MENLGNKELQTQKVDTKNLLQEVKKSNEIDDKKLDALFAGLGENIGMNIENREKELKGRLEIAEFTQNLDAQATAGIDNIFSQFFQTQTA